jgi:hypothetical protein
MNTERREDESSRERLDTYVPSATRVREEWTRVAMSLFKLAGSRSGTRAPEKCD